MKSQALQLTDPECWVAPALRRGWVWLGLLGLACGGAPSPCASFGGCPSDQECLANTCVPRGGEPVTPSTLRSALEPARWHVVSDSLSGGDAADQQQAGVHFGGNSQREALLLDYDLPRISPQQLERAFLIVVPLPDAPQGPEPAAISAWRIIEAWDHPGPLHTPQATHPSARGIASAPLPLRIDVTLLVRRWLENPSSTHGLVLKSSSTQGHPQIFATGVGGGHSPVLELYHAAPAARATQ